MAVGDATIGLLFKMTADSSAARSDIASLRSIYTGNVDAIVQSLVSYTTQTRDSIIASRQHAEAARASALSFQILEGALVNNIGGLTKSRQILTEFVNSLRLAAGGNQELAQTFAGLGVNLQQALAQPKQGLAQFLQAFSQLTDGTQKADIAQQIFLSTNKNLVPALDAAAAGMRTLTVTEATATAGATALNVALLPIAATIGIIVATVGGIASVAAALFGLARSSSETGKAVLELSDKTGISVRNIELLRIAAQEAGKDFAVVERSLDQFVTRLDDAARSTGKTEGALAFKRVGVDTAEGMRDANAALETAIKSLNSYDNATNRAADAQRVFGLRNDQIATILTRVSTSLDDYEAKLNGLGLLTEQQAKQAKSFDLSLNQLSVATSGLVRVIGARLIPVFQPWIDLTTTIVRLIGQNLTPIIRSLESAMISAYPVLGRLISTFFRAGNAIDILNASLRSAPVFVLVLKSALADGAEVFGRFARVVGSTGNLVRAFLTNDFGGAAVASAQVAQQVGTIFDGVGKRTQAALTVARVAVKTSLAEIIANRNRLEKEGRGTDLDLNRPTKAPKDTSEEETRNKLKLLELQEQAVTRLANAEVNAARRAFEARTITLAELERLTVGAENRMLDAKLAVFAEERRQLEASKLSASDKAVKLAEIAEREATARQQVAEKIAQIDAEREKREDAARQRSRDKSLAASDERSKAEIEAIRNQADARVLSFEEAERQIAEIEKQRLEARRQKAREDFLGAGVNIEAQRAALDELAKIDAESVKLQEQTNGKIQDGRQKDLELERRYRNELRQIRARAQQETIDAQRAELAGIDRSARQTGSVGLRLRAIELERQLAATEAAARNKRNLDDIKNDEDALLREKLSKERKEEIEKESNARREAEERRFKAELVNIQNEADDQNAAANPNSNRNVFGIDDESLQGLDRIKESVRGAFGDLAQSAGNLRQIVGGALGSLIQASTQLLANFILTGRGGAQAFKLLAAQVIASLAVQGAIKAAFEVAEGVKENALASAAAAVGNFAGAALHQAAAVQHFAAAKLYGVLAGGALAIGLGIGAAGGLGGDSGTGGTNAGAATGAGAFNGSDARELVFRRPASTEDTERARLAAELRQKYEETGQRALLKLAEAVEGFRAKIEGMRPGDVVTVGLGERPQAAADAVIETAETNGGFVRRLSEAQGIG